MNGALHITSRKYDGTFRFSTEVDVLHRSPSVVLGLGRPGRRLRRAEGESRPDDWSLEYLPLDRAYNIVSFFGPDGLAKQHFCNVLAPPTLEGGEMSYVDLDLDMRVWPDGRFRVEDEDQFERNAREMGYPTELRSLALYALSQLIDLAHERGHIFRCHRLDEAQHRLLALYAEHS